MIYAIGDIHGQFAKLDRLLRNLADEGMTDVDTLVFLGDYIDRGPRTADVIELLIAIREKRPNTVFLRGNHEQLMLDARQRFDPSFDSRNPAGNCVSGAYWFNEGAVETLRSYGLDNTKNWISVIPESHWSFMAETQIEYVDEGYIFVHAGLLPPGKEWVFESFEADPRLWIREEFHGSESDFGGKVVVFGHTPTRNGLPMMMWNKIGIDTGAGYGGPLTAVGLPRPYKRSEVRVFHT